MTGTPYAYYPPEASIAPCSLCLRQHRAGSRRLLARPGSRLQFLADQFCTKGTEGSNPVSSSGESRATAQDRVLAFRAAGRGYARGDQARDRHREPSQERLKRRVAAFEDCGTLTAASASTGAINLLGGKMRRVRAVCLPASEGVGPRVRIRLAPAASQERTVARANERALKPLNEETQMFAEETAKVFGVPFELIPFKVSPAGPTPPTPEPNHIYSVPEKAKFEITFPVVTGYHESGQFDVFVDWDQVAKVTICRFRRSRPLIPR